MAKEDEEKTAFITLVRTFCYICIPFGLNNAGPTYQLAMLITLESHIRCNIEAYINNLVVKTKDKATLLNDLAETFNNLHHMRMKPNHEECVFGVPSRKPLGFLVSSRGIEVKPKKITPLIKCGRMCASKTCSAS